MKFKLVTPAELHNYYLEATKLLDPKSFNKKAQKKYNKLTKEQQFIDKYIAKKINEKMIGFIKYNC